MGDDGSCSRTQLTTLAKRYPTARSALAELANLDAILTLPIPTVHVVSDVHGEHVKFRHVVNNASGSLRPRLARLFAGRLDERSINELLSVFYYPHETWQRLVAADGSQAARLALLRRLLPAAMEVIRDLARGYTLKHVQRILPDPFDGLYLELMLAHDLGREAAFIDGLIDPFVRLDRDEELLRLTGRAVRNLAVGELVVAGDLGDRGPRIDKVIDHMMRQPECSITWGNHDASWMGACLGQPALIATVLRLSLRYRRLSQLEEGYGITMAPLENLARVVYQDDPAAHFACKGEGLRDSLIMARMHKAAAILQFKLEGQIIARHPEWQMQGRALLGLAAAGGKVAIDGAAHVMQDANLPTVDPADPWRLSPDENRCMARLCQSFLDSATLWRHMCFVARHGAMWLCRDRALIFHGCVPVDDAGEMLAFPIDGQLRKGRALFDAFGTVVHRAFRDRAESDLDHLWYLWTGPLSPCFGKDRMATFESYFLADEATHREHKNPYFRLLHDEGFCRRVLDEFGVDTTRGLIVNGHVPVKVDQGETPVKTGRRAVTIDGAFAAAYGDRGYSLVLGAERIYLAQHHHVPSVGATVDEGADIIPSVSDIQVNERPRTIGETEKGELIRQEILRLEMLIRAYDHNDIRECAETVARTP